MPSLQGEGRNVGTSHAVVRNSSIARPDTGGAPHTSFSNQSSTETQKWPSYMTVLRADQQYTSSHLPLPCDMLRSPTERPVAWSNYIKGEAFRGHNHKQLIHPTMHYTCPILEVRHPLPYQDNTGASVKVPSHCYQCTMVHR